MGNRHDEIAEAYDMTFKWILEDQFLSIRTNNEHSREDLQALQQATRTQFISWLRSGGGIYWVSGKAGSGKSTLMKSIREASETRQHLSFWAGEHDLFIGHFYFYDRGGTLEKSQVGLFRHLLHQIFTQYPHLMADAFKPQWKQLRKICHSLLARVTPPNIEFSMTELLAALRAVMSKTIGKIRMCIFIDGLDEFAGTDREVIQLITQLTRMYAASSEWHKLCLSSRPHTTFETAFKKCPSLRMQDLTQRDIHHYVHSQLTTYDLLVEGLDTDYNIRFEEIVENVVKQARGVFLWVRLAVMSLLDGLDQFDWIHELEERVKALPPELDSFYDRMVRMIDRGYRRQAARIFRIMLDSHDPPQPVILSFLENDDEEIFRHPKKAFSLSALNARSRHMEQRLKSRFGGLIEIANRSNVGGNWIQVNALFFHQTVREYFQRPEPWKILLEGITVSWCNMEQFYETCHHCTHLAYMGFSNERMAPLTDPGTITLGSSAVQTQKRCLQATEPLFRDLERRKLAEDQILDFAAESNT